MKLVRYGTAGKEKPGLIDAEGKLRDLSRKVKDIGGASLAPAELAKLKQLDPTKLPLVKGRPRLGPCVANPSKFVAIGLNFSDHAKETGSPIPEHPVVFYKATSCIVGPNDNVMVPKDSTQLDWEVELAFVRPITAAFDAPYTKRLGSPFKLDAIELMLMMLDPRPLSANLASIFGNAQRIAMYIARTLRLKLNSQSFGAQSRIVPLCT